MRTITFGLYEGSPSEGFTLTEVHEREIDVHGHLSEPMHLPAGSWMWTIDDARDAHSVPHYVNGVTITAVVKPGH